MTTPVRVHVLAEDGRLRQAAEGLPASFSVTFSEDMESALEAVGKNGCDIAIVELALNGFAFAKDMRGNLDSQARLIMICDRPQDAWLSRQAGADQVLVKPLSDPGVLLDAIQATFVAENPE